MPPLSFQGLRPKTLVSSPTPLFLQPLLPHFASISLQKPSGSDHFPLLPQPHPGVSHQALAWIIAAFSKLSPPFRHFSLPDGSQITSLLCSTPCRGSRVSQSRRQGPGSGLYVLRSRPLPCLSDHSPPATLACSLLLEHTKHSAAPGPLYLLSPLLWTLFPEISMRVLSRLLQIFAQM